MPYRRGNSLRPVNTLKHTVDSQISIPAGTQTDVILVQAVENATSTQANDCDIGSHVRSMFVNVQVINSTNAVGAINNAYCYFFLNPGNLISVFPAVNAVGISNIRKNIFHQEMTMLSDENDSIPITLFKGVLKIPRKASRLGVDDTINVRIGTPAGGPEIEACVQCIYKEIR